MMAFRDANARDANARDAWRRLLMELTGDLAKGGAAPAAGGGPAAERAAAAMLPKPSYLPMPPQAPDLRSIGLAGDIPGMKPTEFRGLPPMPPLDKPADPRLVMPPLDKPTRAFPGAFIPGGTIPRDPYTLDPSVTAGPGWQGPTIAPWQTGIPGPVSAGPVNQPLQNNGTVPRDISRGTSANPLIQAIMLVESGGNSAAVSPKGAQGLMQVMPATGVNPGYGVRPLQGPEDNVRFGTDYFNAMQARYRNTDHALMAYNWGPGNVDAWLKAGADPQAVPAETVAYVGKVKTTAAQLAKGGGFGGTSGPMTMAAAPVSGAAGSATLRGDPGADRLAAAAPAQPQPAPMPMGDMLSGSEPIDLKGLIDQYMRQQRALALSQALAAGAVSLGGGENIGTALGRAGGAMAQGSPPLGLDTTLGLAQMERDTARQSEVAKLVAEATAAMSPEERAWANAYPEQFAGERFKALFGQDAADAFTLGENQVRYGPGGKVIARGPTGGATAPTTEDVKLPDGRVQRVMFQAGAPDMGFGPGWVPTGEPGVTKPSIVMETGTIPPDMQAVRDAEGRILRYEVIPGSKTDLEQKALAEKGAGAKAAEIRSADIVLDEIGRAKAAAGFWTTGFVGKVLSGVASTGAGDLYQVLQSIKANVGFDKLNEMRQNSPTGGALGNVTERENTLLQSVLGSLEQSQSEDQFVYNLNRLESVYRDIVDGPDPSHWTWRDGAAAATAPSTTVPTPQTQQDYDALPAGALYYDPDDPPGSAPRKKP